jgi:hypothetical protein
MFTSLITSDLQDCSKEIRQLIDGRYASFDNVKNVNNTQGFMDRGNACYGSDD